MGSSMKGKWRQGASLLPAVMLVWGLAGCVAPAEQMPVDVHAAPTHAGVGWGYRGSDLPAEAILAGQQGHFDIRGDAAQLEEVWSHLDAQVTVGQDEASPYILIRLDDKGTGRLNPLRGGPLSWDLNTLQGAAQKSLPVMGEAMDPRYSLHLVALEDEHRPNGDRGVVAQVRLRRLAGVWMREGVDPRMITGQVWDRRERPTWKLAIVLRPYRYGDEGTRGALIPAGEF